MRRVLRGLMFGVAGYLLGGVLTSFLVTGLSSNTHDRDIEAAMAAVFVGGPLAALFGVLVGTTVRPRTTAALSAHAGESPGAATAEGYDALADEYVRHVAGELAHKPFDRDFLTALTEQAPAGPILDAGCGPGHLSRFVADRGRATIGVDLSPRMVAAARAQHPDLRFEVGDMRALPLAEGSCAAVMAFYSIIHFAPADLPNVFAELRRVLQPDGVLAVAFHLGDEVRHVDELWGVRTSLDFRFFTEAAVTGAIREAGFVAVEATARPPYDPDVEAQTTRCYVRARRPTAAPS